MRIGGVGKSGKLCLGNVRIPVGLLVFLLGYRLAKGLQSKQEDQHPSQEIFRIYIRIPAWSLVFLLGYRLAERKYRTK